MTRILSLDPGGKTGAAIVDYFDDEAATVVKAFEIPNALEGFLEWYQTAEKNWDIVVCESFTLRPGIHGVDLSPVYIIGALEALERGKPITYQEPKLKPLCDDSRLKQMGIYEVAMGHANDAIRHGIIYLRAIKHLPTLRKGWN